MTTKDPNKTPVKIVKIIATIIDSHLTNIAYNDSSKMSLQNMQERHPLCVSLRKGNVKHQITYKHILIIIVAVQFTKRNIITPVF